MRVPFLVVVCSFFLLSCAEDPLLTSTLEPSAEISSVDLEVLVSLESPAADEGGCCEGGNCVKPLPNAQVSVYGESESALQYGELTDHSGSASFKALQPVTYSVEVATSYGSQLVTVQLGNTPRRTLNFVFQE